TPQSHRPTCQTIPVLSPHSFLFSFSVIRPPPRSPLFPYTTLFRSQVDLATTEALAAQVGPERLLVSESGIYEPADIQRLRQAGARAFLIGESLMRQPDVAAAARRLAAIPEAAS